MSTNGIISFSRPFPYHSPHLFPGSSFYSFLVAPFWTDNDISNGVGLVSYQVHDGTTESLNWVSSFISQRQQIRFNGNWMLVAEWRNVPKYLGDASIVIIIFDTIIMTCIHPSNNNYYDYFRPILIKQLLSLMDGHLLPCSPTTVCKWNGLVTLVLV